MRLSWITAVGIATAALTTAVQAVAQDQTYETPSYTTGSQSTLEKGYGMPTFATPGSELPQQRTMAPVKDPPAEPDFFKTPPDFTLPKTRTAGSGGSEMDTPQYTTSGGSTLDGATKPETGGIESDSSTDR